MAVLHISTRKSDNRKDDNEALAMVTSAIEHEITRLTLSLSAADKRLAVFEREYDVSSDVFYTTMTAEDLRGGDEEYIRWAGEYELRERLRGRLEELEGLQYEY
jgi:hypothetical protein